MQTYVIEVRCENGDKYECEVEASNLHNAINKAQYMTFKYFGR